MPSEYTSALEFLLLSPCFLPGKNSFKENDASVIVNPDDKEEFLFFSIDNQKNKSCQFSQLLWGKQDGKKICDLIVFYARGENERVICFVELKNNRKDFDDDAIQKFIDTHEAFRKHLKSKVRYKAFLTAHHGSAPQKHSDAQKKLKDVFGRDNYEFDGKSNELDKFLRGESHDDVGRGKRKKLTLK